MAVLGDDALGDVAFFRVLVVIIVAVQEHDDIRVLLDSARFTKVGEHGALVLALFVRTRELGEAQHGDLQLLCHDLEHTGNIADHLLAALAAVALRAGGRHQLQVVDDYQT